MSEHLELGIHDIPAERYFAAEGVSASELDILAQKTPAHLQSYRERDLGEDDTPAKRFGHLLHYGLLQPDLYRNLFYIRPDGLKFTTKEGKQWRAEHSDKPDITAPEAKQIQAMVDSVHAHPFAKRLLHGGLPERSIFVEDSHGTLRKSRLDALTTGNIIVDVKTCESAAIEAFERLVSRYRWHVRGAYYLDNCNLAGIEKDSFFFICVEKSPPYCVRCLQLNGEVAMVGRTLYQRDLQIYRTCMETGKWHGWEDDFTEVSLPAYEMRQIEMLGA